MLEKLNTPRLSLEIISTDDKDFILELVNTKGWLQFIGDRKVHSKADAIRYIKKIIAMPGITYWVVRILEPAPTPVGVISFIQRDYLESPDLGFAFLPQFGGKGYAYEAASEVLINLRKDAAHKTILATTLPSNQRSISLLKKLGFQFNRQLKVDSEALHLYSNVL